MTQTIKVVYIPSSIVMLMNTPANSDWVGWVIGLVAVALAVLFYFKSKANPRLVHQWGGRRLVGGNDADLPEEVTISYKGTKVPCLSSTDIVFWNAGTITVRGLDIVETDPLRVILCADAKILRARVSLMTRSVNSFTIKVHQERQNEALCTFDYLDSGDGARVEILHTSEKQKPQVVGTIRGLPKGVSNWGHMFPFRELFPLTFRTVQQSSAFYLTVTFLGLAAFLAGLFLPIFQTHYPNLHFFPLNIKLSTDTRTAIILGGALYIWYLASLQSA